MDYIEITARKRIECERMLERFKREMDKYRSMQGFGLSAYTDKDRIYYTILPNRRNPDGTRPKEYVGSSETDVITGIKMYKFLHDSIRILQKDIDALRRLERKYQEVDPNVFRKKWAAPYKRLPEECFSLARKPDLEKWRKRFSKVHYLEGNESIHTESLNHFTEDSDIYRSKSEELISKSLSSHGLSYCYEYPTEVNGREVYPDFTVLSEKNQCLYIWEHFGMVDNPEYLEKTFWKLCEYQRAGHIIGNDLIVTFESRDNPLNGARIRSIVETFLVDPYSDSPRAEHFRGIDASGTAERNRVYGPS